MSIAKAAAKAGKAASKAAGKIHEANVWIAKEFKNNVKDWMSRAYNSVRWAVKWAAKWAKKTMEYIGEWIREWYQGSWKWASAVTRKAMSRAALKSSIVPKAVKEMRKK